MGGVFRISEIIKWPAKVHLRYDHMESAFLMVLGLIGTKKFSVRYRLAKLPLKKAI